MYKIQKIKINGFWHRFDAECEFNNDVNIIIGKNGTGKTTFMNILYSVLSVDLDGINHNDFDSVEIFLIDGKKKRTVKAKKIDEEQYPFTVFEYQVSQKKYKVRLIGSDNRRLPISIRKRAHEESSEIRSILDDLISLSSLSVYRMRSEDEYEVRDRHGARIISPVDYRLSEILRQLTHYQLELSISARDISSKLQKDVLASILYGKEDADQHGYELDFEKNDEKTRLISAYRQLNAIDSDVSRKITFHVSAIDTAINELKGSINEESEVTRQARSVDFRSLEALRKTRKIISMSLDAEEKTEKIFSQISLFLSILKSFIEDKDFVFESGDLIISNKQGVIPYERLSSGEKQLLILLTESLLQKQRAHVFLADEPELSLHIQWQRMVIPAILQLNPQAQVIAATHSPEVASKYRDSIFDMENLINA
jgi:predicted ATP-dependent endonuclease of OLD family